MMTFEFGPTTAFSDDDSGTMEPFISDDDSGTMEPFAMFGADFSPVAFSDDDSGTMEPF